MALLLVAVDSLEGFQGGVDLPAVLHAADESAVVGEVNQEGIKIRRFRFRRFDKKAEPMQEPENVSSPGRAVRVHQRLLPDARSRAGDVRESFLDFFLEGHSRAASASRSATMSLGSFSSR